MKITRLRQVAIPSRDFSKSVPFYRDLLGAEWIAEYDPPGLAFFRLGETRLLLDKNLEPGSKGVILYFAVPEIHAAHAELAAKGVAFEAAPQRIFQDDAGTFGAPGEEEWMAFFKDPDGNVLALASRGPAPAPAQAPAARP